MSEDLLTREQKLEQCLARFLKMVDSRELVRNTLADHQPDWALRMLDLVTTLKEARDLVGAASQGERKPHERRMGGTDRW